MHGFGDFKWANGKIYSGFYKKDFKDGLGLLFNKGGLELYFGFWAKGQKEGIALCINSNKKYFAFYEKGKQIKAFTNKVEALKFLNLNVNGKTSFLKFLDENNHETLIKSFSSASNQSLYM